MILTLLFLVGTLLAAYILYLLLFVGIWYDE